MTTTPAPTDKLDAAAHAAVNGPADDTLQPCERIVRRPAVGPQRLARAGCAERCLSGSEEAPGAAMRPGLSDKTRCLAPAAAGRRRGCSLSSNATPARRVPAIPRDPSALGLGGWRLLPGDCGSLQRRDSGRRDYPYFVEAEGRWCCQLGLAARSGPGRHPFPADVVIEGLDCCGRCFHRQFSGQVQFAADAGVISHSWSGSLWNTHVRVGPAITFR